MKQLSFSLLIIQAITSFVMGMKENQDYTQDAIKNIAMLRSLSPPSVNGYVLVEGYSEMGDRGGGIFLWDPASRVKDDDGVVIRPNQIPENSLGRWVRMISGETNVCWFGAKGDGKKDDTKAIQRTFQYVITKQGGTIFFPMGTYLIRETIRCVPANVHIQGEGATGQGNEWNHATTIITDQPIVCFDFGDSLRTYWSGPHLENIAICDRSPGKNAKGGIRIRRMNSMTWENVALGDFENSFGIHMDGIGDWIQYNSFVNLRVYNCKFGLLKTGNFSDNTFIGGYFHGTPFEKDALIRSGSRAFYDRSGTGGRNNFYRVGFNNWEVAMEINGLRACYINGSFEQYENNLYRGIAILLNGTGVSSEGNMNVIIGSHFTKFSSAIVIGEKVRRTQIMACTFENIQNKNYVMDNGIDTFSIHKEVFDPAIFNEDSLKMSR